MLWPAHVALSLVQCMLVLTWTFFCDGLLFFLCPLQQGMAKRVNMAKPELDALKIKMDDVRARVRQG